MTTPNTPASPKDAGPPAKIWICPSGDQTWSVQDDPNTTPELQYVPADLRPTPPAPAAGLTAEDFERLNGELNGLQATLRGYCAGSWEDRLCMGVQRCLAILAKQPAPLTQDHGNVSAKSNGLHTAPQQEPVAEKELEECSGCGEHHEWGHDGMCEDCADNFDKMDLEDQLEKLL